MGTSKFDAAKHAEEWARKSHSGQMYGDRPYIAHVEDVVHKIQEWGFGDDGFYVVSAWVHDMVEDCGVQISAIEATYGQIVAEVTKLVTDPEGKNRKERKANLYKNFQEFPDCQSKIVAAVVKCADRFANQQSTIVTQNKSKAEMYIKEFPTFMRYFGIYTLDDLNQSNLIWDTMFAQYRRMVQMIERVNEL